MEVRRGFFCLFPPGSSGDRRPSTSMGTPKGEQAPLFSSPFGRGVAAPALKPGFSFDWKRGRDKTKEQALGALGNLSSWGGVGDTAPFTSRQRWKHFVGLLMLSGFFFVLAGAFLPLVLLRPQKFCLFFTMGSILNMASFAVLRGPVEQLKHMFSLQRCARLLSWPPLPRPPPQTRLPPTLPITSLAASLRHRPSSLTLHTARRLARPAQPLSRPRRPSACHSSVRMSHRSLSHREHRLPFTSAYLGSMVLTLWAALVVQSYVMVSAWRMRARCAFRMQATSVALPRRARNALTRVRRPALR